MLVTESGDDLLREASGLIVAEREDPVEDAACALVAARPEEAHNGAACLGRQPVRQPPDRETITVACSHGTCLW